MFWILGMALGGVFCLAWWSIDMLFGTRTLTLDKTMGLIALSGCFVALLMGAMMLIDDWRTGR